MLTLGAEKGSIYGGGKKKKKGYSLKLLLHFPYFSYFQLG